MPISSTAALAIAGSFSVGSAPFDALDPGHIAAGASTIVHIDFQHAAATELGGKLLDYLIESNEDETLAAVTSGLGISPGEEIRALTVYSGGLAFGANTDGGMVSIGADEGEESVLLIYGTEALERWDEALAAEEGGAEIGRLAGRPVRELEADGQRWAGVMLPHEGGRLWAIASTVEQLGGAVGVIEGRGERADLGEWPVAAPAEGSFLYIAVRDFERLERWEPVSDVAQRAEGFALAVGQHGEEGFARMQITVENAADAEAVSGVCQGVIGLARLTLSGHEEMLPLLSMLGHVRFTTEGRLVEVLLEHDAAALSEALEQLSDDHGDAPEETGGD